MGLVKLSRVRSLRPIDEISKSNNQKQACMLTAQDHRIEVEGLNQKGQSGNIEEAMEVEESGGSGVNGIHTHWLWTLASTAQLGWGISSFRKGYAGDCRLMPFKAFGVATLFVGSGASASVAFLQASGIHKVEDLMEVGANIRRRLGIPSRTSGSRKTDDL